MPSTVSVQTMPGAGERPGRQSKVRFCQLDNIGSHRVYKDSDCSRIKFGVYDFASIKGSLCMNVP